MLIGQKRISGKNKSDLGLMTHNLLFSSSTHIWWKRTTLVRFCPVTIDCQFDISEIYSCIRFEVSNGYFKINGPDAWFHFSSTVAIYRNRICYIQKGFRIRHQIDDAEKINTYVYNIFDKSTWNQKFSATIVAYFFASVDGSCQETEESRQTELKISCHVPDTMYDIDGLILKVFWVAELMSVFRYWFKFPSAHKIIWI